MTSRNVSPLRTDDHRTSNVEREVECEQSQISQRISGAYTRRVGRCPQLKAPGLRTVCSPTSIHVENSWTYIPEAMQIEGHLTRQDKNERKYMDDIALHQRHQVVHPQTLRGQGSLRHPSANALVHPIFVTITESSTFNVGCESNQSALSSICTVHTTHVTARGALSAAVQPKPEKFSPTST